MSDNEFSKEEQIIKAMKSVLTMVARDTHTKPGLKHPLADETIYAIRDCLALISAREQELAKENGRESNMRPRYVDEPKKSVVVSIDSIGGRKKKDD